jgi:hypothetical protein
MAKGFMVACKVYFQQKEGQTLGEFSEECKALTAKDKLDMVQPLANAINEPVSLDGVEYAPVA